MAAKGIDRQEHTLQSRVLCQSKSMALVKLDDASWYSLGWARLALPLVTVLATVRAI